MFDTEVGTLTGDTASEIMSSGPDVFLNFLSNDAATALIISWIANVEFL